MKSWWHSLFGGHKSSPSSSLQPTTNPLSEPDLPDFDEKESMDLLNEPVEDTRAPSSGSESTPAASSAATQWSDLLQEQCPYLRKLIESSDGHVDPDKLEELMNKLSLKPCTKKDVSRGECLQRNCAILWRYYIQRKHNSHGKWKRCGSSLVSDPYFTPECAEARNIADHMFNEREHFAYRPGDISFLYDLTKVEEGQDGKVDGTSHRVSKRRGDAILRTLHKVHPSTVEGNNIVRYLMVEQQLLHDFFVSIYSMEVGKDGKKKSTSMYLLTESMDGNLDHFQRHFQRRDPQYWCRLQRMLIHSLSGLNHLHELGFAFRSVRLENLLYKLDWENNLIAVKWTDFDSVKAFPLHTDMKVPHHPDHPAPPPRNDRDIPIEDPMHPKHPDPTSDDLFAFGLLVYRLLFCDHPAGSSKNSDQWRKFYNSKSGDEAYNLQKKLRQLLQPNSLQPLSTAVYHFVVNERLFPDEKRWNYEQALHFIEQHPEDNDETLSPLPPHVKGHTPPLPRPFIDW